MRRIASFAARGASGRIANRMVVAAATPRVEGVAACWTASVMRSAVRHQSSSSGAASIGGNDPKATLTEARALLKKLPAGCVHVTSLNVDVELAKAAETPMVLYFHAPSNAEVLAYTRVVLNQIAKINLQATSMSTDAAGAASGNTNVVIKCGLVDCERDYALAQTFRIQPDLFPLFYFVAGGKVIDKMYGIHPESQVAQAFNAFLDWTKQNGLSGTAKDKAEVPPEHQSNKAASAGAAGGEAKPAAESDRPDRVDEYEENAMTLQAAAIRKTQAKEYPKAFELFTKARTVAEDEVKKLKVKLGVQAKKLTPEISEKLKRDPNYLALPQAICGQAMVRLGQKNVEEAFAFCQEVRRDYAWAVRDNRQIADTLCRVELIKLSNFDVEKDNYITLMKNDEIVDDPVVFYSNQLRLAVAHYFERHPEIAIDELLKLIRAEAKLLPALQKAGYLAPPENGSASTPQNRTPARRAIFLLFEALGNGHGAVVDARKKLAAFLFT